MTLSIMPRVVVLSVIMLGIVMLSVIMLRVNMLSVIMLNVNMLGVVMRNDVKLNVVVLSVIILIFGVPASKTTGVKSFIVQAPGMTFTKGLTIIVRSLLLMRLNL
jgi:hypothetical protein